MHIKPLSSNILVEACKDSKRTPKTLKGAVVALTDRDPYTEAVIRAAGRQAPPCLVVGTRVLLPKVGGTEIHQDGSLLRLVNAARVVAIISETTKPTTKK